MNAIPPGLILSSPTRRKPVPAGHHITVAVTGDAAFADYLLARKVLDAILAGRLPEVSILTGGTRAGADECGRRYAKARGLLHEDTADPVSERGRAPRPTDVLQGPSHAVFFWNGTDRDTQVLIRLAVQTGLEVRIVRYDRVPPGDPDA